MHLQMHMQMHYQSIANQKANVMQVKEKKVKVMNKYKKIMKKL